MSRRRKAKETEVRYDAERVRMSDAEAHRGVVYATAGSPSQLLTVYRHQMRRYHAERKWIAPLIAVLIAPVIGLVVTELLNRVDPGIGFGAETLTTLMLVMMPFGIIFLAAKFTNKVLSSDFSEGTGYINLTLPMRRSVNLAGRYLAAFTMCALMLAVLYGSVAAVTYGSYGEAAAGLTDSFIVALAFSCAYLSFGMVFNAVSRNQTAKMYALLFLGVPALFMLLMHLGSVRFSVLQYIFPLSDTVTAVGSGFGGMSLFTAVSMMDIASMFMEMPFSMTVPAVSLAVGDAVLLGLAWGLAMLALAMILYGRREM
jgi:ABC-type transport system involved in multi-copper enzyme maturation permease subunit